MSTKCLSWSERYYYYDMLLFQPTSGPDVPPDLPADAQVDVQQCSSTTPSTAGHLLFLAANPIQESTYTGYAKSITLKQAAL